MSGSTHFIGIGGTGLSAIARVLLERGVLVTGSDRQDSVLAQALRQAGAVVHIGHAAENINGAERVVRSSAVTDDNIEVQAALAKGIPVLKRSEFLGELLAKQQVVAVAGSHGKTTTTAMIAWMLTSLGEHPGFIIGSVARNLGTNAAAGAGQWFVIEADEYDYAFLGLSPKIAVVTNVEHDHPDMFATPEDFQAAFEQFVDRIQPGGTLVYCADDPGAVHLADYAKAKGLAIASYAYSHKAEYQAVDAKAEAEKGLAFTLQRDGHAQAEVNLQVPGEHNVLNALAALAVADLLDLPLSEAALALSEFRSTARRFDVRGEAGGVLIVDDYAHHPTEIRSVLAAARARYPERRIWAVWQPHTFSRTLTLQSEFAQAFGDADRVLMTQVYAAREQRPEGFSEQLVVDGIQHADARFSGELEQTQQTLMTELQPGDMLLIMSAGDAIEISENLFVALQHKEEQNA